MESEAARVSAAVRSDRALLAGLRLRPLRRVALEGPRAARRRRRRFLDPVAGRVRRLERALNQWLSLQVYPRVPGIARPYGRTLARRLVVAHAQVAVAGLAEAFQGLRVLWITDIHAGPFLDPRALAAAFERLSSLQADLILYGGDFATSCLEEFAACTEALRALRAPLGRYAVLGNHDHYTEHPEALREALETLGIGVLHNRHTVLRHRGASLVLSGVDDWNCGQPDLDAALPPLGQRPGPVVLLSHNPDVFFEAAARDVALVLAGHTHGGQIRLPKLPVLVRMSRYGLDEGRYAWNGSELVVSRGLGAVGLPLRWGCPPEAVLLELEARGPRAPSP